MLGARKRPDGRRCASTASAQRGRTVDRGQLLDERSLAKVCRQCRNGPLRGQLPSTSMTRHAGGKGDGYPRRGTGEGQLTAVNAPYGGSCHLVMARSSQPRNGMDLAQQPQARDVGAAIAEAHHKELQRPPAKVISLGERGRATQEGRAPSNLRATATAAAAAASITRSKAHERLLIPVRQRFDERGPYT